MPTMSLFPDADPWCADQPLAALATAEPTAIWVSVSGGLDSAAAALWARRRWPTAALTLVHMLLADMEWPEIDDQLDVLAATLGNATVVRRQAIYELTGDQTPTGANATRLRRVHDVDRHGLATDADPAAITTLLDFATKARNGQPPTASMRYCTSYFKSAVCDAMLRQARTAGQLGARPVLITGERWAESPQRSRLTRAEWRVPLQPTRRNPQGQRVLWLRPIIDQTFHQVVQAVLAAGLPIPDAYYLQGETLGSLLDPTRDERGRARMSCLCCIFSSPARLQQAARSAPEIVSPHIARIQQYEATTGYSWQQRGPLTITLPGSCA